MHRKGILVQSIEPDESPHKTARTSDASRMEKARGMRGKEVGYDFRADPPTNPTDPAEMRAAPTAVAQGQPAIRSTVVIAGVIGGTTLVYLLLFLFGGGQPQPVEDRVIAQTKSFASAMTEGRIEEAVDFMHKKVVASLGG